MLVDHYTREFWVCYACMATPEFTSEEALISHTIEKHEDTVSETQMTLVTETSKRRTPAKINSCPICNWPASKDTQVGEQTIRDHIADHIHDFAFFSLPSKPDDGLVEKWGSKATYPKEVLGNHRKGMTKSSRGPVSLSTIPESDTMGWNDPSHFSDEEQDIGTVPHKKTKTSHESNQSATAVGGLLEESSVGTFTDPDPGLFDQTAAQDMTITTYISQKSPREEVLDQEMLEVPDRPTQFERLGNTTGHLGPDTDPLTAHALSLLGEKQASTSTRTEQAMQIIHHETFKQVLDSFKTQLTPTQADEFGRTTLDHVERKVHSIKKEQERQTTIVGFSRIRFLLDKICDFDEFCKQANIWGDESSTLSHWIWGPMFYILKV